MIRRDLGVGGLWGTWSDIEGSQLPGVWRVLIKIIQQGSC